MCLVLGLSVPVCCSFATESDCKRLVIIMTLECFCVFKPHIRSFMYCCITRPLIVHLRPFYTFVIMCSHFCSFFICVAIHFLLLDNNICWSYTLPMSRVQPRSVTVILLCIWWRHNMLAVLKQADQLLHLLLATLEVNCFWS